MRKSDIIYTAALVPIDFCALLAAGLTAYAIRFAAPVQEVRPVMFQLKFIDFFTFVAVFAAVWIAVFAFSGLYTIHKERKIADDVAKILLGCSTGMLVVILTFFFSRELFSSRFIIIAAWGLAILYVLVGRLTMRALRQQWWLSGRGIHEVAFVGDDPGTRALRDTINLPAGGHRVVLTTPHWNDQGKKIFENYMAAGREIDELVLTDPDTRKDQLRSLLDFCTTHQITFKYSVEITGLNTASFAVDMIAGIPVIELKRTHLEGWGKVLKRGFDVTAATIGLALLAPITAIIGILIKWEDGGPILVALTRMGARGRKFKLYKYRSMVVGAEQHKQELMQYNERADGPLFKMANDPRITRMGKFLRRYSLDELPQLWNVLTGDMSLVGPRPHEPQEVAKYEVRDRQLLFVRPGITGMAQVSGRTDLTFAEEARIDTFYVQHWSFLLDLIILLKTPFVVLKKTGV